MVKEKKEKKDKNGLLLFINMGTETQPTSQVEVDNLNSVIQGVFDKYGIVGCAIIGTGISSVQAFWVPFNK